MRLIHLLGNASRLPSLGFTLRLSAANPCSHKELKMKKLAITLATITAFAAAVSAQAGEILSVAASAVPHAEILEFVKPALAKEGVELKIKVFTDYVQPNVQVAEGRLDANFFQHQPYLDEFNKTRGSQLTSIAGVHIEPFGAYSSKIKSLAGLPQGANVVIPNDATNGGRALLLLVKAGIITLKEGAGITATVKDIASNPKAIKVRELEAATLPRVLNQVDLALINTNYALEAGLNPAKDALIIEGSDSPYVNILVVSSARKDDAALQKLAKALHSVEVKTFINDKYKGAVVPAF
jgi:D-methionine transport system substrate-binding protein